MDQTIIIGQKKFTVRSNPNTGKLDMYDADGEHIGQAPSVEAARRFLADQVRKGALSAAERLDEKVMKRLSVRVSQ